MTSRQRIFGCSLQTPTATSRSSVQYSCLARNVWKQIQRDTEEAYDRTAACTFTSFIAYEYTAMPALGQCSNTQAPCFAIDDCSGGATCLPNSGGANNLHRNIIFRNDGAVEVPLSYAEAPIGCGKGDNCIKRHLQEHRAAREGGEQGRAARLFGDLCALKRFFHTCKGTIV
jgi:uncharacterized protein DUF3604